MTVEQTTAKGVPETPSENAKPRFNVNSLTILLVFVFLLVLVAESVAASSIVNGNWVNDGAPAGKINLTREFETCIAWGKSEEKCNKTATAMAKKSPTPKSCEPYKTGRAVNAGETFEQYVQYYKMTTAQRDDFIKINSLSPAYPNTVIYAGVKYCLPYGINVKVAEGTKSVSGYDPSQDFGFEVIDINGYEISFDLHNFQKNDKVNVWYWKKPPGASGWHCQKSIDDQCYEVSYRDRENFSDGYSETRKIWLAMFKVSDPTVTLVFPQEVADWNYIYVCMHSLFRSEDDESHDASQHSPSYHSYCQYIKMARPHTEMITRLPAATQTGTVTSTPTAMNTPCGYVFNPVCRPLGGGFWGSICGGTPETGYACLPPCPGARLSTPTSTPCGTQYGASCPGTRIPFPTLDAGCPGVCQLNYHIDPVYTPTYLPGSTPCNSWWLTPGASR